jgi:hypothetical protein
MAVVQQQVDSLGISTVASTPAPVDLSQQIEFFDCGVKVDEAGSLAPNSDFLFARKTLQPAR